MSDEFTIPAKMVRNNMIDEHHRYEQALEQIVALDDGDDDEVNYRRRFWTVARIAREALQRSQGRE